MADTDFPVLGFNFKVKIDDDEIGFQEVSGLGMEVETEDIDELGNNGYNHKVPKKIKYNNIILKKGKPIAMNVNYEVIKSFLMFGGPTMVEDFYSAKISIELCNEKGEFLYGWNLVGAFPVKVEVGSLNAEKSEIVIETMEFAYQYLEEF